MVSQIIRFIMLGIPSAFVGLGCGIYYASTVSHGSAFEIGLICTIIIFYGGWLCTAQ